MAKISKVYGLSCTGDLHPVIRKFVGHLNNSKFVGQLNKRHRDITNKNTPPIPAYGIGLPKSKSQRS